MLHPLRRNIVSLSVAQVVARLSATLLAIFVARLLGPGPLGLLAFAQAITIYFTVLSDFGLTTLGVREIAKDPSETSYWATRILEMQLVATLILLVILGGLLWLLRVDNNLKLVTLLFGAAMIPAALDMSYVFLARQRMEFVAFNRVLGQLTFLLCGVLLVLVLRQAVAVPIANFIGAALAAIATFIWLRRQLKVKITKTPFHEFARIGATAAPFVVGGILTGLYHNAMPVVLRSFTDFRSVGLFSAGYRIVAALLSAADVVSNALFPAIAYSFANDKSAFLRHSLSMAQILGGLSWGVTVVGSLVAPQIFAFLFGAQYAQGLDSFRILMILPLLGMLSTALTVPLLVANQQVHCMLSVAVGVAMALSFSVLLVPTVGINGAAIATIVGEVGLVAYLLIVFAAKLKFAGSIVKSYILKPALASLAAFGVYAVWTYFLRLPASLGEGIVLAGVYGICAVAIRLVPAELVGRASVGKRGA